MVVLTGLTLSGQPFAHPSSRAPFFFPFCLCSGRPSASPRPQPFRVQYSTFLGPARSLCLSFALLLVDPPSIHLQTHFGTCQIALPVLLKPSPFISSPKRETWLPVLCAYRELAHVETVRHLSVICTGRRSSTSLCFSRFDSLLLLTRRLRRRRSSDQSACLVGAATGLRFAASLPPLLLHSHLSRHLFSVRASCVVS